MTNLPQPTPPRRRSIDGILQTSSAPPLTKPTQTPTPSHAPASPARRQLDIRPPVAPKPTPPPLAPRPIPRPTEPQAAPRRPGFGYGTPTQAPSTLRPTASTAPANPRDIEPIVSREKEPSTIDSTPADTAQPPQTVRKKKTFKVWHLVLSLLIAAVAIGGVLFFVL